ncbi:hypothetical protein P8625_35 [Verrucomicrobia phage P8625]|uniref:hypothetical protein n=1 Tax=Verrucomicrobia phage P8625 TaxID=1636271 RepID=UPI0005FEB4C5|nr:hypothetical protein AWI59_gp35 [Verrucomicrobia phage P8625]AKA60286.1 hypothetical protein P8625_35 [Verrucomicrobia phage P8625]
MSNLITLPDIYETEIEIIAEAFELKANAIRESEQITSVEDGFEASQAADVMATLKQLEKGITDAHKESKAPVLRIARHIDGLKRDYLSDIESERLRLSRMLGTYQAAEREKQRKAEEEARRKEREAIEAEKQKQLDAMVSNDEQALKASDEAIERVRRESAAEIASQHSAVKGVRVRTSIKFEIEDVATLQKHRPDLFSPDESKIRAALKITQSISGLKVWEEKTAY